MAAEFRCRHTSTARILSPTELEAPRTDSRELNFTRPRDASGADSRTQFLDIDFTDSLPPTF
ncbi:hypothetical protein M569_00946 [Genlisea aurea]|uniref:Uncharacterized protein n=1 Tax=Genlisea aurea TaxID=192259 RepID=S8D340_9LAMI|nr:hypothetical protein M569_00946 [Genlisea aurea]